MTLRGPFAAATALLSLCVMAEAEEKVLAIELNTAGDFSGGCRLAYVARNGTGALLDTVSYEVFTFDAQGNVGQSLIFQFGRLPAGKTKVVQFDLADQPCAAISRLLINDITECVAAGKNSTVCIDALATTTRASIAFGL